MAAGLVLFVAAVACPQGVDTVFTVRESEVAAGQEPRTTVAADRRQITCLDALEGLGSSLNWNVRYESQPLRNALAYATVNLNFENQDPRMVAHLVAVAAGADVVFADPEPVPGARTTLHVVREPDSATESGRQRMRAIAGQWYRSFLRDELRHDPLVSRESVRVRMSLGQLLVDSGDLESAIRFFTEVYDQKPNDQVAAAILKIAESHLDLAGTETDRNRQKADYAEAEHWVRELLQRMPSAPEVTRATVLLGRALLGQAKAGANAEERRQGAEACQNELRARVLRLIDSVELLDVWLLMGEARLFLGQPDRVYETMLTLRESAYFDELLPRQYLDYHFLLGYGALGVGKKDLAMRSLEWFLIHAENDPRQGIANVLLAETYLGLDRLLEARAASVEARKRYLGGMTPDWRQRALEVWARTALALGDKEDAFRELEVMVMRGEEPELALFLSNQLLQDRQWERAISVVKGLLDLDSAVGDRARFQKVVSLYEQAVASKHLDDFPPQAIALAPRIHDTELASKVAGMIGDAYTRLGKLEHAADAYRGILR
ncbi:MAG: hypothetical protein U1E73_03965 [Planctomycetota bacterium]